MLGLRQRLLAERAGALELGRRQRRQLQRGAERKAVAAECQRAFEQRRDHDDAADHDALVVLHGARDLGGAEAAVALAQNVFRRTQSAVLGDVERDHFRHRFGVAVDTPERAAAVGLGRPAPAGADRIDQHQIGEGEPGVRVVHEMDVGAVKAVAECGDARADQAEIEKRRGGARPAVEHEGQRPARIVRFDHIGGIEDCGRALARLIEQRERTGGGRVGELAARNIDAVLGDGVAGQQRQHSRPGLLLSVLARVISLARRSARVLLRDRGGSKERDPKRNRGTAKIDHVRTCSGNLSAAGSGMPAMIVRGSARKMAVSAIYIGAATRQRPACKPRGPVDNQDRIGEVLTPFRPHWSSSRNGLSPCFESADALHRARSDAGAGGPDLRAPARRLGR